MTLASSALGVSCGPDWRGAVVGARATVVAVGPRATAVEVGATFDCAWVAVAPGVGVEVPVSHALSATSPKSKVIVKRAK